MREPFRTPRVWVLAFLLASVCTSESSETQGLGNRIIAKIHVGETPEKMVVGDCFVWVTNHREGSISRIDPKTNEATTFPIANRGTTWEIAIGGGFVWLDQDTGINDFVTRRIDVRTGRSWERSPWAVASSSPRAHCGSRRTMAPCTR